MNANKVYWTNQKEVIGGDVARRKGYENKMIEGKCTVPPTPLLHCLQSLGLAWLAQVPAEGQVKERNAAKPSHMMPNWYKLN